MPDRADRIRCGERAEPADKPPESLAHEVSRLLRGSAAREGVQALEPLSEWSASEAKHPEKNAALARTFAASLSKTNLDALSKTLADGIHVGDEYGAVPQAGWKYGSPHDRLRLAEYLWRQAMTVGLPPADVRETGTAALELAAMEGYLFGGSDLEIMLKDLDAKKVRVLGDNELVALKKVLASRKEELLTYVKSLRVASDAIYRFAAKEKFPAAPDHVQAVLDQVTLARADATDQYSRFRIIDITWRLLNLTRKQQDAGSTAIMTSYLMNWRTAAESPAVERWLTEAMVTEGPAPVVWPKR